MTEEEKQLLLIDLCGRVPFGVMVHIEKIVTPQKIHWSYLVESSGWKIPKPYLRPMSSMTEEEEDELMPLFDCLVFNSFDRSFIPDEKLTYRAFDWLNKHHFDYRGLIEKGLALEAPEGMYNIKQ